jgi:hypothetical protein
VHEAGISTFIDCRPKIAHCPLMNAFLGLIAPVNEFRKRGINVALGIDNMFGDYFDVIRSLCSRPTRLTWRPSAGARAMGMENEISSLEIGKRADLIMLDYCALGLQPVLDPRPEPRLSHARKRRRAGDGGRPDSGRGSRGRAGRPPARHRRRDPRLGSGLGPLPEQVWQAHRKAVRS